MLTKNVVPSIENSWENMMKQFDIPLSTLKLRNSEIRKILMDREMYERYIGVIYRPDTEKISHYSLTRMSMEYDFVIFHEKTSAIGLLE